MTVLGAAQTVAAVAGAAMAVWQFGEAVTAREQRDETVIVLSRIIEQYATQERMCDAEVHGSEVHGRGAVEESR